MRCRRFGALWRTVALLLFAVVALRLFVVLLVADRRARLALAGKFRRQDPGRRLDQVDPRALGLRDRRQAASDIPRCPSALGRWGGQ